jgi:chromosome segregation protein
MRLERLEINGFKSFSDRSELAFDKGVTAIVGPNGCGKSNVADAITWVMGEQSAKSLRGERMEDVIFNGSDARKPTAAAEVRLRLSGVVKSLVGQVASVNAAPIGEVAAPLEADAAITIDAALVSRSGHTNGNGHHTNGHNGHGNGGPATEPAADEGIRETALFDSVARDVEVTRRLYRSGDSEYLIDGHVCRLRDVHDLLMDTGLGAKAYAIIEQGKIGLILSSRPIDRRQIIEEAAGVTKYKVRRRAAELKLEAARQNLTRVEDIVFEVEKQRSTLKRQAAKARRYRRLRDELRRWEQVLFARKYRQLAVAIETVRARLAAAREREGAASARVVALESHASRLRIELVDAEARATGAREAAHASELAIRSQQQQTAFDREQIQTFEARGTTLASELEALEMKREPARLALEAARTAASAAAAERDRAATALAEDSTDYESAHRAIEGMEADVEAARSEVFSAINSATALRHALEHAGTARDKVLEALSRLDVETADVRIESERAEAERTKAADQVRQLMDAISRARQARAAHESELTRARSEHQWRERSLRTREQDLAGLEARLRSLEELQAARAGYDDGARTVLARAGGGVNQHGAVADYLDVDPGYERAVEACLGDLLQYVVVERPEHAAAGFAFLREQGVGRCGFVIAGGTAGASGATAAPSAEAIDPPAGLALLSARVRVTGPFADAIRHAMGQAFIAADYDRAEEASGHTLMPVATLLGDLFRGAHVVSGGVRAEARGILETKREISELRQRIEDEREAQHRLAQEIAGFEATIVQATGGIAAVDADCHEREKAAVAHEAQLLRASDEADRLLQRAQQLARERRQAEEELEALNGRDLEARRSIERLERDQQFADERLTAAQRRLLEAREAVEDLSRRKAERGATHAALMERAAALEADVHRLDASMADLHTRTAVLGSEADQIRGRLAELRAAIAEGESRLDSEVHMLEARHQDVRAADSAVGTLREEAERHEVILKEARTVLEADRAQVAELDVARATAEADLVHLSEACQESVQATLDEVVTNVERLEQDGMATPEGEVTCLDDGDEGIEETLEADAAADHAVQSAERRTLSAEEAIAQLRGKIDRLGPVNMMAIEQFDELEARHSFLSGQRRDLVESIDQTTTAIKRIDETTRRRFAEAFAAINHNFQHTFGTLFGGGRAGLALLDESDPLESGIEIIAQPPGKRLQSVQLLSGGEKALTAIALMFALFQFKPSPFCLLDEIDAPLDDANIGRFVDMLRSMQQHTQFILITHNRKTMEIADRLYGVTMEEPGVSKLISVQLN